MPNIITVTDLNRPELAVFTRLTEAQLRSRRAPEKGLFIAESAKVIGHALEAGYEPVSFLMSRKQLEGQGKALLSRCGEVPVYTAEDTVLERLTGYAVTRGFLCAMRRKPLPSVEEVCAGATRVAVLENLADPTNVGAVIRSAAALNMDAVLVTPSCCDPLHRRAVRVSMGTVFQIPWTRIGAKASDWPEAGLALLRGLGFRLAAMALDERAVSLADFSVRPGEKLALLLGTEGDGLSLASIKGCDDTIRIPMGHGVDSLNVAAASAVAFWQLRDRKP